MPPKSKADPKKACLALLQEKNRPFSSTTMVDELHGEFPKTAVQKSLDALADEGKITCKICGKSTKLYFANQEGLQVASSDELTQMEQNNENLRQKAAALKERLDELRTKKHLLSNTHPIPELIQIRDDLIAEIATKAERRDQLIEASEGITPEVAAKANQEFTKRCDEWRKRRAKCMEIVDELCESADKKRAQFMEELDMETDETYNVKLIYQNKKYTIIDDFTS